MRRKRGWRWQERVLMAVVALGYAVAGAVMWHAVAYEVVSAVGTYTPPETAQAPEAIQPGQQGTEP